MTAANRSADFLSQANSSRNLLGFRNSKGWQFLSFSRRSGGLIKYRALVWKSLVSSSKFGKSLPHSTSRKSWIRGKNERDIETENPVIIDENEFNNPEEGLNRRIKTNVIAQKKLDEATEEPSHLTTYEKKPNKFRLLDFLKKRFLQIMCHLNSVLLPQ